MEIRLLNMKTFLGNVAQSLWDRYGSDISSVRLLVPNARSRIFFSDELAGIIDRPAWEPSFVTVDQLMTEIAAAERADGVKALVELYKVYSEYHNEDFDRFYHWGEMLLADFDQVDKYMVDAGRLFSNLGDLKVLEESTSYLNEDQRDVVRRFWLAFGSEESYSDEKKDFLKIWDTLYDIYTRFRERLSGSGIGYTGMIHRIAAENIKNGDAAPLPGRYAIIGFNALTVCEKVLLDYLRDTGLADFFWDYDEYYLGDKDQEAGLFLRENTKRYPQAEYFTIDSDNFGKDKNIVAVSVGSDSLQCKYASTFIGEVQAADGKAGKETAIILTDENLLVPLLYSIPESVDDINVTMGYPLRQTLAYSFVERLLKLHARAKNDTTITEFYHADVTGILSHPYVMSADSESASVISADIIDKSMVYVPVDIFTGGLIGAIFKQPGSGREIIRYVIDILSKVEKLGFAGDYDKEYFATIAETLNKLGNSVSECGIEINLRTLSSLARRMLQSVRIPYSGEPLSGLQVMGILETRNLDFENVMIMSMNDDNFPGSPGAGSSFIPYNLRLAYGLPTPKHHEGVYAYYFYRLIQRARNVHMVYCSRNDESSSGEQSRYIYQLEYESPHQVLRRQVGVDVVFSGPEPIAVPKTGVAAEELRKFLDGTRSISPSAFNAYLDCPLKFYFRSVAGLKTEDAVAEEVDIPMFGTILHKAMEILYTPLKGNPDPRPEIKKLIGSAAVGKALDKAIKEEFFLGREVAGEDYSGNLQLVRDVVLKYINEGILPFDAGRDIFVILDLEKKLYADFAFEAGGRLLKIRFYGLADRIDMIGAGLISLIDYKTGSPHSDFAGAASLFGENYRDRRPAVMQTFLYSLMANRMQEKGELEGADSRPALYYVRMMNRKDYSPWPNDGKIPVENYSAYKEEIEGSLKEKLAEMFDSTMPFSQCADTKPCEYCDFNAICRRV